jgi:hypothetical protein
VRAWSWIAEAAGDARLAIRRNPLLTLLLAALLVLLVSPIWRTRFLPLLDEPNHVASVYIFRYLREPSAHLSEWYARSFRPVPYASYHAALLGLSYVLPLQLANKVLQSAYVLSFPMAGWLWARRTGRSPLLALLVLPLGYSQTWALGMHPFNTGLVLMLLGVCAFDALLEKTTVWRMALVAVLAVGCAFSHPLACLGLVAACAALSLAWLGRPLAVLTAAMSLSPSIAMLAWHARHPGTNPFGMDAYPLARVPKRPWLELLETLPRGVLEVVSGEWDLLALWMLVGTAATLLVMSVPAGFWAAEVGEVLRKNRGVLPGLALLCCHLVSPLQRAPRLDWWFTTGSLAVPVCFFLFLLPTVKLSGRQRWMVVPMIAASVILLVEVGSKYAAYGRSIKPLVSLAAKIPPGDTAIALVTGPRTHPSVNVEAYRQLGAWLQVLRGGFGPTGFHNTVHPYRVLRAPPVPHWSAPEGFDFEHQGKEWSFVIVHGVVSARLARGFELAAQQGEFSLYRRRKP